MKTRTKRILIVLCTIVILIIGGCAYQNRLAAIKATLEWGRLAPFPASTRSLKVTASGGLFSRSFRSSFTAKEADIEQWLQQSPGIRDAELTSPSPGVRHYQIKPGSGAQFAEVTVDDTKHLVSLYVWWS